MKHFTIYETVKETRRFRIQAETEAEAVKLWEQDKENGEPGDYCDSEGVGYEVHEVDEDGEALVIHDFVEY